MSLQIRSPLLRAALAAAVTSAALLAGCATTPPSPPPAPIDTSRPLHLTGRFSFSATDNTPGTRPQHSSGRFILDRNGNNLGLELISHFGQTLVRAAQKQGEQAWLETAQHQRYLGTTLEAVLQQAVGMPIPVSRLPQWLNNQFETIERTSDDGRRIVALDGTWHIEREDNRWYLTWQQNTRRIEIRLVADQPVQNEASAQTGPSARNGSSAAQATPDGQQPAQTESSTQTQSPARTGPSQTGPSSQTGQPAQTGTQIHPATP